MKGLAPVLAAGGTFAGCVLLGVAFGTWAARATGRPLWIIGGLLVGLLLGGYSAMRLLLRSL